MIGLGYDTVATGSNSLFCDLFTKQEFLDFEYSNDLHYFHMLGSGSKVGPFLGSACAFGQCERGPMLNSS